MQYFLTASQLKRIEKGIKAAIAILFIDDIEDYIYGYIPYIRASNNIKSFF